MKKVKNIIFFIFIITIIFACNIKKKENNATKDYFLIDITANIDSSNKLVLSPSSANFDSASANGLQNVLFVFYPRDVFANEGKYVLLNEYGDTVKMPASLVIPLPANKKVSKGQYVLTWWQKATGMQRAIVLNKDSSYRPIVFYLDNFTSPSSSKTMLLLNIDTLKKNSFLPISDSEIMSGRSFMDINDSSFNILINKSSDSIVGLSWAGFIKLVPISKCVFSNLYPSINIGDTVLLPYVGTYKKAVITKLWKDIGKVKANVFFLDTVFDTYANICDIIKE